MMASASKPLVAAEVDLRDFAFLPLDVVRLRDSDLAALATGDGFRAAVLLWCVAWHQQPAASLPDNDVLLSRYAGFGRDLDAWAKVREEALRGFEKCADGRLYHRVLAEKANEAWAAKVARKARTAAATAAKTKCQPSAPKDDGPKETVTKDTAIRDVERDENRDDERNVLQGKGREGKGQGIEDTSAATSSVTRDAAAIAASKRIEPADDGPDDEFRQAERACVEALGGYLTDGGIAPADANFGPMMLLIDGGAPLKSVVTALRSFRSKPPREPVRTWHLWAEKTAKLLGSQPRLVASGSAAKSGQPTIEIRDNPVPESRVVEVIAVWEKTGVWPERWSSPPGEQFCEIPRRLWPPRMLEAAS